MTSSENSFIILSSVDSTNNYAMARVHEGLAKDGDCFFTSIQTMGKGQMGRVWQSSEGENIALSIVTEPDWLKTTDKFYLSAIVALACFEFFYKYAGDETTIKWPNDIYWRDRKAGGILIENVLRGNDWKWAIIGIGININQTVFDAELKNPVSLKQITGKNFDPVELAKELHSLVYEKIKTLSKEPPEIFINEYNKHLYKINSPVRLKKENAVFETTIGGVNANGQLLTHDSLHHQFNFGEVEWIL